jgi:hypothetical protein
MDNDNHKMDEYIEKMKSEPFRGSYQVRSKIQSIEAMPDFYRKNDLLEVLMKRYDDLLTKDFTDIFSSFK